MAIRFPLTRAGLLLCLGLAAMPSALAQAPTEEPPGAMPPTDAAPAPEGPAMTPGQGQGMGMGMGMAGPDMMRMMREHHGMMRGHGMGMMQDRHDRRDRDHHGRMGTMGGDMMGMDGPTDPVEAAFAAINRRMHQEMAHYAGEPDRAFAQAMIAHHQGAVDMAKVILAFGADPEIRNLAQQVIQAQEQEITMLRQWLAAHPER